MWTKDDSHASHILKIGPEKVQTFHAHTYKKWTNCYVSCVSLTLTPVT